MHCVLLMHNMLHAIHSSLSNYIILWRCIEAEDAYALYMYIAHAPHVACRQYTFTKFVYFVCCILHVASVPGLPRLRVHFNFAGEGSAKNREVLHVRTYVVFVGDDVCT